MGTNYYVRYGHCKTCGRHSDVFHIGKSSSGWFFSRQEGDKHKCFIPSSQEHPILEDEPIEKKFDELREQFSPVFDKITDPEGYIDEMRKDDWDE